MHRAREKISLTLCLNGNTFLNKLFKKNLWGPGNYQGACRSSGGLAPAAPPPDGGPRAYEPDNKRHVMHLIIEHIHIIMYNLHNISIEYNPHNIYH